MSQSKPSTPFWVVIPAAGRGSRFGAELPKQYLKLAGKAVIEHSISVFLERDDIAGIMIALHADDSRFATLDLAKDPRVRTTLGGNERADSVERALQALATEAGDQDWVLVHDAARPCLSPQELQKLVTAVDDDICGAILALPVVDTVKRVGDRLAITETVDRSQLWRALTPQLFRYGSLLSALQECRQRGLAVTDEASALENTGQSPRVVQGSHRNIKITFPDELKLAEHFLATMAAPGVSEQ